MLSYLECPCCISSVSYIKPQRFSVILVIILSCISSVSYIKPQLWLLLSVKVLSCISSVSYIKPQLLWRWLRIRARLYIVRFLHQTTTIIGTKARAGTLYIVRFLHQTTTVSGSVPLMSLLYIVRFLHQTTTHTRMYHFLYRCISSVSYIKPQRRTRRTRR